MISALLDVVVVYQLQTWKANHHWAQIETGREALFKKQNEGMLGFEPTNQCITGVFSGHILSKNPRASDQMNCSSVREVFLDEAAQKKKYANFLA